MNVYRGDVFYTDLGDGVGSEQKNKRPCVIIQNNIGNTYSPTVIIACMTTSKSKRNLPTHVYVAREDTKSYNDYFFDSTVLCEQVRTIDKTRLIHKIATVSDEKMEEVSRALKVSFDILF